VIAIKRTTTLLLIGAALAAAGCGSDDEGAPIPAEQADALLSQLENVQYRLDNGSVGACQDIFSHPDSPNQQPVEDLLAQIPQRVDPEVRSALEESFARLWELVDQECDQREQESQPEEPAAPEPEPEPEVTDTVPPEETAPPEEEPTPPEEETLPPEGNGNNGGGVPGNGNGNGNGLGNGGGGGGVGPGGAAE
jgi:outer membrane biosynthesis protein TonB